ncbi:MAG: cytochrome P450 [Mycetocola sp.]
MSTDWTEIDNNLLNPYWYVGDESHAAFKRLRDDDPVHWTKDDRFGRHYWSITRYDDVKAYLLDHDRLSSRWQTRVPRTPERFTPEERYAMGFDVAIPVLDNPWHDVYRRPANKHFSVPAIAKMSHDVDAIIDEVLLEVADRGACDLVEDISAQVPLRVVFNMLGIPRSDWDELQFLTWQQGAPADPRYIIDGDHYKTHRIALQKIADYCLELAHERRKTPRDDFATVIANFEVDGSPISPHEIQWWFATILRGGLETTRNTAAVGLWLFMEKPDQREKLLSNPGLMKGALEEVMRWVSPARNRLRIANEKMQIGGNTIAAGDWVVGFLASANRDERAFDDPDTFDITRTSGEHLALGAGIHLCLGRNLARVELASLFSKALRAFPDLRRTDDSRPEWIPDASAVGFVTMPVTFTPASNLDRVLASA